MEPEIKTVSDEPQPEPTIAVKEAVNIVAIGLLLMVDSFLDGFANGLDGFANELSPKEPEPEPVP